MMWRGLIGGRIAVLVAALAVGLAPAVAGACAKDGVPSVSADGRLASMNHSASRVEPSTWTMFVFTHSVIHGHVVVLAENNREVARALPADVFKHPWRWNFGDRQGVAYGTRVRHTYRKPGTYRITVYAYYAGYSSWQPFDNVTIHVR